MEIRYKGLQYDLPQAVTDKAQKKLLGLKKYLGTDADTARAYVELGRETTAHQSGRIWVARINFSTRGTLYRAEATEETIENAIDEASNELAKELRRAKRMRVNLFKRGGLMFKSFSRGF
ncbi:MAG TPA: HPF/RaiA family ribosome-associated protein [Candidatus Paceibacterota bacterium]|nr:HPF/RaiA family ribosome-associated protein [Candidatus Paceibacterota bacterium]